MWLNLLAVPVLVVLVLAPTLLLIQPRKDHPA